MHGLGLRSLIRCLGSSGSARGKGVHVLPHPDQAVVTGAFSYTGRYVARRLLDQGIGVRTLTRSLERENPFRGAIPAYPLDFSDPDGLRRSMEGAGVLYNTYWIRFGRGRNTFEQVSRTPGCFSTRLPMQAWAGSSTSPWPTPRPSPGCPISGARGRWRRF